MNIESKFSEALKTIPAPGGGGCHAALLGVANLGIMAGHNDAVLLGKIRAAIPAGRRKVSDREIMEAIKRAHEDTVPLDPNQPRRKITPLPRREMSEREIMAEVLKNPAEAARIQAEIIKAGGNEFNPENADVWEASPVRIWPYSAKFSYAADMLTLLKSYSPDDLIYIGNGREVLALQPGHVKGAAEWYEFFRQKLERIAQLPEDGQEAAFAQLGAKYPHILPNPINGVTGKTQSGSDTMRGDANVKEYRCIVGEFDDLPILQQGAFWRGLGLPLIALIHSGGKSIHAWIKCDGVNNGDTWQRDIKSGVFALLGALGADKACSNPARLSRLPGMYRPDKKAWQRLLYLAPNGGVL